MSFERIKETHIRFDWAIKKMLRSKANFVVLEGFLSELLKYDIKILNLLESESNKEYDDNKLNRVDLLVEDSEHSLLIIEVQNSSEVDYFHRMAFSASRLMSEYLEKSQPYGKIRKIITVNIVYFDLGQGGDYVYHGSTNFVGLHNPNDILVPSKRQMLEFNISRTFEIFPEHYIIKVNNFNDLAKDSLDEWIYFLKNSSIPLEFKAKGMEEARSTLLEIKLPTEERKDYQNFIKKRHDDASFVYNAKIELKESYEEGEKKGKIEGKLEGKMEGKLEAKIEVAKQLLAIGMPMEQVIEITQVSAQDLSK